MNEDAYLDMAYEDRFAIPDDPYDVEYDDYDDLEDDEW